MAVGAYDDAAAIVTGRGYVMTLRCANPECHHPVAQAHAMGPIMFRVLCCPACGCASEYASNMDGWTLKLLPKQAAVPAPKPKAAPNGRRS